MRHFPTGFLTLVAMLLPGAPALALDLSLPLACTLGSDCFVQNYVDLDPGDGVITADCGRASYDGHKGTDVRVLNTSVIADVLAAAPGEIKALRNDIPDRLVRSGADRDAVRDKECGNGVVIAHGEGWETQYCHMRQGTVSVSVGETVQRGQVIGRVGYSGFAAFPHVHLTVRKDGETVDPFLGSAESTRDRLAACSRDVDLAAGKGLWLQERERLLRDAAGAFVELGFAGKPVGTQELETDQVPGPRKGAPALVFFARLINLQQGDRISLKLTGPDGVLAESDGQPLDRNKAQWVAFAGRKTPQGGWPLGAYAGEAVLWRAGKELMRKTARIDLAD
ncbi:M23 family metallopeptidase [Roseibium sp. Sym1]|uniref:M23 family metallopeptidase n=1 Tax=Roseibium sp. Sym1 TaxID=3016006 RepID=UPI0022B3F503|nr:M23 family metallopeptidase [Roseibium sp. Sym1]